MRREPEKTEMMSYTANSKIGIYNVKIENLQRDFNFNTELNTVDNNALIIIPNPNYESMLKMDKSNQFYLSTLY